MNKLSRIATDWGGIAALAAVVLSFASIILSYGRADGASSTVQSTLVQEVQGIKQDIKEKVELETSLQVQLGVAIERIDELNRRLDRLDRRSAVGLEEPVAAVPARKTSIVNR